MAIDRNEWQTIRGLIAEAKNWAQYPAVGEIKGGGQALTGLLSLNNLHFASQYTDLAAAIAAIGATETSLIVDEAEAITDHLTIPATMSLLPLRGGEISIATAKILTIESSDQLQAGSFKIFAGAGDVYFGNSQGVVLVAWFGAYPDGVDCHAAISKAFTVYDVSAAESGGVVKLTGSQPGRYLINDSIIVPRRVNTEDTRYKMCGESKQFPVIMADAGLVDKAMIDGSGTAIKHTGLYREYSGMRLRGDSKALIGLDLQYSQHFTVENMFIQMLDDGASRASGIRVQGAICSVFRDVNVHNSDGDGICSYGGSGAIFNANLLEKCVFLDLGGYGLNITGGFCGCSVIAGTFETCERGISLSGYSIGGSKISGSYFEDNDDCDLYIGTDAAMQALEVDDNYFNGYITAGHQANDYSPIKMKFAKGTIIRNNSLNRADLAPTGYHFLDANIAGGALERCIVEHNRFGTLPSATSPADIYNIGTDWVDHANSLIDERFVPLIKVNLIKKAHPYGWSKVLGGASLFERGADMWGSPGLRMKNDAGNCYCYQTITLDPGQKGKYMTVGVPVRLLAGASNAGTKMQLESDGTGAVSGEKTFGASADDARKWVTIFVPSDAIWVKVWLYVGGTGNDWLIGHPCLYVGASAWYDNNVEIKWQATAAPTVGAWVQGDIVWKTDAAAGGSPGWACTATGSPGTWTALSELELANAAAEADSTAADVAGIVADHNSLLAKLRTAKLLDT